MHHDFVSQSPERVRSGIGSVNTLAEEVDKVGGKRALIITGNSLSNKTDLVNRLQNILGDRCAGVFDEAKQHVLKRSVMDALQMTKDCKADTLISFGGGSPIDTMKMVTHLLIEEGENALPNIAIPTTLSAGEFTFACGMTDEETRVKTVYGFHPALLAKAVILDPEVTIETPDWLWGASGMRAVDHAIEAIWAPNAHPITTLMALDALKELHQCLASSRRRDALELRLRCQHAAWMSIFGLLNLGLRLTHPIGHQLGARFDIPHGVTSCISLPVSMRLLYERTTAAQELMAEALGVKGDTHAESAKAAADAVTKMVLDLGLPSRLSETTAIEKELPELANEISKELKEFQSPDADFATPDVLLKLLREAW